MDASSNEYQDSLKSFITQQMKDINSLKVKNFRKKYKDWANMIRKSNKIEQNQQNPYNSIQIQNQQVETVNPNFLLHIIDNLSQQVANLTNTVIKLYKNKKEQNQEEVALILEEIKTTVEE